MQASDLKPGQFFIRDDGAKCRRTTDGYEVLIRYTASTNFEVTPLSVTGWDDEPQRDKPSEDLMAERFVDLAIKSQEKLDQLSAENAESGYGYHKGYRDALIRAASLLSGWDSWIHARMRNAKHKPQPTVEPLQLREGAWYRTEDRQVFGPAKRDAWSNTDEYCWLMGTGGFWNAFGKEVSERHKDLIAEVPPPTPEPEQFKAGDLVVCVDATGTDQLKHLAIYQITDVIGEAVCVDNFASRYRKERFRRATAAEIAAYKEAQEPQPDAEGWIAWSGGERPVDGESRVDVRFREPLEGEPESEWALNSEAEEWEWDHTHGKSDIVAYRLVPSPPKEPPQPITDWTIEVWR